MESETKQPEPERETKREEVTEEAFSVAYWLPPLPAGSSGVTYWTV